MTATFIHGFTQTGESWSPVLAGSPVSASIDVECVDLPGHGGAPIDDSGLWDVARSIARSRTPGPLIGYSMGGRIALHVALTDPDQVSHLVLISATPGIESESERNERRAADDRLAARLESMGVESFLAEWLDGPLFRSYAPTDEDLRARRTNTVEGLAASLRRHGTGHQDDLWPRLRELRMPVLLIVGSLDVKFTAIAERMASMLPDARLLVVEGSGHAVHLERPVEVASAIRRFTDG